MKLIPLSQRDALRIIKVWKAVHLDNGSPQIGISARISSLLPLGFLYSCKEQCQVLLITSDIALASFLYSSSSVCQFSALAQKVKYFFVAKPTNHTYIIFIFSSKLSHHWYLWWLTAIYICFLVNSFCYIKTDSRILHEKHWQENETKMVYNLLY